MSMASNNCFTSKEYSNIILHNFEQIVGNQQSGVIRIYTIKVSLTLLKMKFSKGLTEIPPTTIDNNFTFLNCRFDTIKEG